MLARSMNLTDGRLFFRYVVPSMISMVTAGIYTLIDGLFIGWVVGSNGLAALNVAFPLSLLGVACGEMIGMGGAINIALSRGKGAKWTPSFVLGNSISLILPGWLLVCGLLLPFLKPILSAIGAAPELLPAATEYAFITILGCVFMMMAVAFNAAICNDGAPRIAMGIMVAGLVSNIVLDYLFIVIFRWGVAGSAWGTVAAQAICCFCGAYFFFSGRSKYHFRLRYLKLHKKLVRRILTSGLPSLGLQLTVAVVVLLHNRQALIYGGVSAVAAYAILSYFESTILMVMQGVGMGIQPIIGFLHGAENIKRRNRIVAFGIIFAVGVGVIGMSVSAGGANIVPQCFRISGEVAQLAARALVISAIVYPFLGFQKISESYFQAIGKPSLASTLVYGDCFVVLPLCLIVLPIFFGTDGIWVAMPVSKIIMSVTALCLWFYSSRRQTRFRLKRVRKHDKYALHLKLKHDILEANN